MSNRTMTPKEDTLNYLRVLKEDVLSRGLEVSDSVPFSAAWLGVCASYLDRAIDLLKEDDLDLDEATIYGLP